MANVDDPKLNLISKYQLSVTVYYPNPVQVEF